MQGTSPSVRALVEEPPYHLFILTGLTLALGAGFALATLVPLSMVLDWGWGGRYRPVAQVHGQVQILGWVGMFILGMAYRLIPRFSGRPLRFPALVWTSWAALSAALVLRLVPLLEGEDAWQRAVLVGSAALGAVSGAAFALVVVATVLHPKSRAGATAYFVVLGAGAFAAQSVLGLVLAALAAQRGQDMLRPVESFGMIHLQLYGFIVMFILGVSSRVVPTLSGLPRPETQAKALALALSVVVVAYVVCAVWVGSGARSATLYRVEAAAFAALGPLFVAGTWLVGIFRPSANRVAAASQRHIWFLRAAFGWLLVAGGLAAYYGVRAAAGGKPIDYHGIDAVRHDVGIGVATMMIAGMAMLIVPEFAIRRMRHPAERMLPLLMLALLNAATALRVAAAVATPHWVSLDRYWPMAVGGGLAEAGLLVFAVLFAASWLQKRSTVESILPVQSAEQERSVAGG